MDLEKLGDYEFLDLSDIDENERQRLKETLYSEGAEFLQLPWTNEVTTEEWQKETYVSEILSLHNGPEQSTSPHGAELEQARDEHESLAQSMQPVTMYSPMPAYTMPPPSTGYQHPQNVFVTNVTANVHTNMPHYVQPQYDPVDIPGRGHRGRGRVRTKHNENMMESTPYAHQYVAMYPYAPYYSQPMGSPIQHANTHAPGSSLYITPVYPPQCMYGAYPPPAPQYFSPQGAHVNNVMEDAPEIHEINLNTEENLIYQHHEEYDTQSQLNVNNIDTNKNNTAYINNNVKIEEKTVVNNSVNIGQCESVKNVVNSDVVENKNTSEVSVCSEMTVNIVKSSQQPHNFNTVTVHNVLNESRKLNASNVLETSNHPTPKLTPTNEINTNKTTLKTANNNIALKTASKTSTNDPEDNVSVPKTQTVTDITSNVESFVEQTHQPAKASWASLFSSKAVKSSVDTVTNEVNKVVKHNNEIPKIDNEKQTDNEQNKNISSQKSAYKNDPISHRMGEFLVKYALDNRTVSLQPRGLTNRSNYCYINSILQALLACPPFYNLLKALPYQMRKSASSKSPTPIIDSMIDFVNEFMPLAAGARLNRKEKGARKDENMDVPCGLAFEPSWIYKILNGIRSDTFIVEGRQEDAEEFFGCLLNGLNDEMLELMKLVDGATQNNKKNLSNGDVISNGDNFDDEDEWKVMGPKNKGSVTRRAEFDRSPISDIFRGQLRSRVHRTNTRASQDQITDNVQPFFTLQLDIEKPNSVMEALEALVHKDKLEGVTCSKTKQQVEAWQQVTVEELPLVLVLHLKCFNYKLDVCSKIIKALEFPVDLKIDSKLLSTKAKYNGKQKQYKLFAVVYHDGKEVSKGHYLTDAFHVGYGGWIRYDDSTVKSINESQVLHPTAARVPYLLFYRRCDTIGNQNKKD